MPGAVPASGRCCEDDTCPLNKNPRAHKACKTAAAKRDADQRAAEKAALAADPVALITLLSRLSLAPDPAQASSQVQRVDALEQEAAVRQRELDSALQRVNALEQEAAARQRELEAARQRELEAARQRELEAALQRELEAALQRVNALEQEAAARQCELEAALQRVNALEQEAAARQQRAAPSLVRTLQQPPQELQETPGIQRQQTLDLAQLTHKALRAALRIVFVVNARQARIRVHDTFKSMFNEYVEFAILRQDASNHGDSRLAADAFVSLLSTQFEALQSLPETTQKAREWMDKLVETFRKQVVSSTCCLAA